MVKWNQWNSKKNNFKKNSEIKSNLIYGKLSDDIPKVSIMIITYKRVDGLKKALESALNQNYKLSYEIIVVDDSGYDAATDKLMKQYCKKYKNIIYYRHEKNLGQYANWNRACELCRTEWYCLLHDDDMLKENYLTEMTNLLNDVDKKTGLIGCYFEEIDSRNLKKRKGINLFVNLFIKLRRKKPIYLTLKDNLKNIFTFSCCLFINKKKVMDIGGLDDNYFPSSDFILSAKMDYYYKTCFFPEILCYRGVGDNESLKLSVCNDSISCAYELTYQIAKELKYNEKKSMKKASISAVISEIGVKGYNDVDYGNVKRKLKMKKLYNNKFIIFIINLYSKYCWGKLLFRR